MNIEWHKNVKYCERHQLNCSCLRTVPPIATAHTLCASRVWSELYEFSSDLPTSTRVFLRGLRLCGKCRSYQGLSEATKKIGGSRAFFRDN